MLHLPENIPRRAYEQRLKRRALPYKVACGYRFHSGYEEEGSKTESLVRLSKPNLERRM